MRYFERDELAHRYHRYRPRVQRRVIGEIAGSRPARSVNAALDVACGTGHSTAALAGLAPLVCGCDVSAAMLAIGGRDASIDARFVRARAESLPFSPGSFDLVTVSMGFHWLDQRRFLAEAARVLVPGGELWLYNLLFPGVLEGDRAFTAWYRDRYFARYPIPRRHAERLSELLRTGEPRFAFVGELKLRYEVGFTAVELRSYLTTQSNVEAALRQGEKLPEVDAWLDHELAPFFGDAARRRFAYVGYAEIAAVG